jgi:hypothetical protein
MKIGRGVQAFLMFCLRNFRGCNIGIPPDGVYFDVVVGLAGSNDPDSYAGGSIATGRVTQAGQVERDDPE